MEDDLRVQMARLEERMNTMQAEYKTDIALLAKEMADGRAAYQTDFSRLAEQVAERDARLAERDADMKGRIEGWRADFHRGQWQMLLAVAGLIGLAVAVLKFG